MAKLPTKLANTTSGPSFACRSTLRQTRFRYTTAAASTDQTSPLEPSSTGQVPPALTSSESPSFSYKIKAAVLLSRPPLLTRDLNSFEKAFFLYQRRLNERLALPFTRYFYYQQGTPGDLEWKRKVKGRLSPSRDIGKFTAYSPDSWNDEVLVGDNTSEPQEQIQALVRDAEDKESNIQSQTGRKVEESLQPLSRVTEADKVQDARSLNRLLNRTLYLLVKPRAKDGSRQQWVIPESVLEEKESLHTAAERIISQTGGPNMNTWIVGNMPVGHQIYNHPKKTEDIQGQKIFYMKSKIMAGQVDLHESSMDLEDYQWVTKQELQRALRPRDFAAVKNVLADR